jgi:hypothetical protein
MNKKIYIFVAWRGFVMSFDQSGPNLAFTQYPKQAQDFDTEQQAKYIIRINKLDPAECFLMDWNK